ncbi:dihydroflavonol-4-reductase [Thermosipho japonicus]|uniref:Dihydroflavonol-4-reductase n=1 Tax=Thermosipho japonicus TaxID=90323 RepID=A0A841GVQ6_9BACT|nr:NAD-dependent epimerase/dehydratase family protein [Thermosipho japonicus]MBB6063181.1 dihydroflavonol-4-reductase [Thermosipho japonicus]
MIFITGGSGHLGNVLIRKLLKMGEQVVTLVHPSDKCESLRGLNVKIVKGDVRIYTLVEKLSKDADIIIHLAALISILPWKKKAVYSVNINGTKNILKVCKKLNKKLIYISSVHAFEEPKPGTVIDENTNIDPSKTSGVYGKSKAFAALAVLNAIKSGLDITTVCPTGIIGPFDFKPSEMGIMFLKYLTNKLKYTIDGSFDFVDVRDVADGIIKLIYLDKRANFYILSNKTFKTTELIHLLNEITGKNTKPKVINTHFAYFLSLFSTSFGYLVNKKPLFTPYSIHTLTRNYTFSHEKATKEINYNPRDIKITLYDTLKWLSNYFLKEKLINPLNLNSIK